MNTGGVGGQQDGYVSVAELEDGSEHVYRLQRKPAPPPDPVYLSLPEGSSAAGQTKTKAAFQQESAGFFVSLVKSLGLYRPLAHSGRSVSSFPGLPDYSAMEADRRDKIMRSTKRAAITFGVIFGFSFLGLCLVYFTRHANQPTRTQADMGGEMEPAEQALESSSRVPVAPGVMQMEGGAPASGNMPLSGQAPSGIALQAVPTVTGAPAAGSPGDSQGSSSLQMLSPGLPPEARYGSPRDGFSASTGVTPSSSVSLPKDDQGSLQTNQDLPMTQQGPAAGGPAGSSSPLNPGVGRQQVPLLAGPPSAGPQAQPTGYDAFPSPETRRMKVSASEPAHRYRLFVAR